MAFRYSVAKYILRFVIFKHLNKTDDDQKVVLTFWTRLIMMVYAGNDEVSGSDEVLSYWENENIKYKEFVQIQS